MRDGGQLQALDVRRAMLWLDLHASGVRAEMAEVKFDWFGQAKPVRAPVELPVAGAASPAEPLQPRMEKKVVASVSPRAAAVAVAGKVWSEGEAGGVVILLEAPSMPGGRVRELLAKMLAAVGLKDDEVCWVGVDGTVEAGVIVSKMTEMAPKKVLVLGQNVLGTVLGRKLGVEGWQAAPCALPGCDGAAVGVTYPPALLLAQPLFKRLAWQHLLAWKMVQA